MLLKSLLNLNSGRKCTVRLLKRNTSILSVFSNTILKDLTSKYKNSSERHIQTGNISKDHTPGYKTKIESENNHVYNAMRSLPAYTCLAPTLVSFNQETNQEMFERLLSKHWRTETATDIVNAFKTVLPYAKANNIPVSDNRYDNLVDGLMDKCQDLTDDELSQLLMCVNEFPKPEAATSHNFQDIWSALDDVCCWRINSWSVSKTLYFVDHWYLLGLSKYSDFTIQAIKKFCRRVKTLSPSELVQALFYINVCRKQWSMFDFEVHLEKCLDELTLDELAIVSMGFFKTETTIKETFILSRMVEKLLQETSTVHEITLCAILKIIRYSPHIRIADKMKKLLTRVIPEIDRLSLLCCVHIALVGTNAQIFHPEVLKKISEKFIKDLPSARLKDLERLTFTLTLFNFNPKIVPDIFESILTELQKPKRQEEIEKYPRCLSCCVHYLGLQGIYPYDLINKILDPNFLTNAYGTNNRSIGREILFMNTSLQVDCPDYSGNRLTNNLQVRLSKWTVHWIPQKNQKRRLTAADKLMLDIIDAVEVVHGTRDCVNVNFILPQYEKADIIICRDKSGKAVELKTYFDKYSIGDVMRPEIRDDLTWYAFVVGGWNMFIRDTVKPVGVLATKLRQLQQIGYIPVLVPWCEFLPLSRKERENYIADRIM